MESQVSSVSERLYEPLASPKVAPMIEKPVGRKTKQPPAEQIYGELRGKIADVFPDDDNAAWSYKHENFGVHTIDRPFDDYGNWYEEKFQGSDDFSKLFTRRLFLVWEEMKKEKFIVNGDKLWEHQKALFAWVALNICTGSRLEMANLLLRSPYGSGKSKVTGLLIRAFRDAQLDLMLLQEVNHKEIPTGVFIGKRREHVIQNAVGKQYAVLDIENLERSEMNQYWKDLSVMYGEAFTDLFDYPKNGGNPFYALFTSDDENESNAGTADERLSQYFQQTGKTLGKLTSEKRAMLATVKGLMNGDIVLILNEENVPVSVPAQLREQNDEEGRKGLTGDSAFALREGEHYRIKASDKHLSPDRSTYTREVNEEDPAQFAVVHGTALTRNPDTIRLDIRREIGERCRGMFLDEAGLLNPAVIGDSVTQLREERAKADADSPSSDAEVSHEPIVIGVTGQDKGVAGWQRSPTISESKMIELGLMKPISFVGIGDPRKPASPGSEQAWAAYEKTMFEDCETAEILGIDQPHEVDSVVVLKRERVHEYAKRIRLAHEDRNVPVQVFIYSSGAGNRKSEVLKAFKAPKKNGDPRRVLVAEDKLIAEALTIPNAQCYDILDDVSDFDMDQIRGRLGHVRASSTKRERAVGRTVIRQQWLHKGRDPYVRTATRKQGYELPDEDAQWRPMDCMIDQASHEKDAGRKELRNMKPLPIPDTPAARRRKAKGSVPAFVGKPLGFKNQYAKMLDEKKKERERKRKESLWKAEQIASEERQHVLQADTDQMQRGLQALVMTPSNPEYHRSNGAPSSNGRPEYSPFRLPWYEKHRTIYD